MRLLQEIFFILALIISFMAIVNLNNTNNSILLLCILLIQFCVHIKLLTDKNFKCNPKSGSKICNTIALLFGITYVIVFLQDIISNKYSILNIFGLILGIYSIISHIIYIPLGDMIASNNFSIFIFSAFIILFMIIIISNYNKTYNFIKKKYKLNI